MLRDRGVMAGDRVAVVMPNGPEVFEAFQAVWKIGAVILPIRPQLTVPEIEHMLRDSSARAVITAGELVPLIRRACPELQLLLAADGPAGDEAVDLSLEMAGAEPLVEMTDRAGDDLALLLYTSGTTGKPKGVMLTHESVVSIPHPRMVDLPPFMPTLHVLPLSHSFGVLMMNLGFIKGMQAGLLVHWDTRGVFEAIQNLRVVRFSMVPTMLTYMLEFPERDRFDTSSLEGVWTGGAPLPDPVRREFEQVFSCRVRDGYGMTESGGAGAAYYDQDAFRPGSVGRAQPTMSIRVVDDSGADVPAGVRGEIVISGPTLMAGYWRNRKATDETLVDGSLYSGDIGYLDEDGYLYLTDRKKDLIIKGGENISPREIEEALYQAPGRRRSGRLRRTGLHGSARTSGRRWRSAVTPRRANRTSCGTWRATSPASRFRHESSCWTRSRRTPRASFRSAPCATLLLGSRRSSLAVSTAAHFAALPA